MSVTGKALSQARCWGSGAGQAVGQIFGLPPERWARREGVRRGFSGPNRPLTRNPSVWGPRALRLGAFPGNMHLVLRRAGKSPCGWERRDCSRQITMRDLGIG